MNSYRDHKHPIDARLKYRSQDMLYFAFQYTMYLKLAEPRINQESIALNFTLNIMQLVYDADIDYIIETFDERSVKNTNFTTCSSRLLGFPTKDQLSCVNISGNLVKYGSTSNNKEC